MMTTFLPLSAPSEEDIESRDGVRSGEIGAAWMVALALLVLLAIF